MQGTQTNAPAGTTSTDAASAASKGNVPLNSITAGGLYTGHVTERTTFATVGLGQVEVGGELLTAENDPLVNRDVANAQVITRDQDIGGLNASMTVDGRTSVSGSSMFGGMVSLRPAAYCAAAEAPKPTPLLAF